MTDFLEDKRTEINDRLAELRPLVEEAQHLEAAITALEGIASSTSDAAPTAGTVSRRRPGRPRGARSAVAAKPANRSAKPAAKRRAGRRKGSGKRGSEALAFIEEQPGISIPELAAKMGIKQNYLYRVLPALEQSGSVRKEGRGWHPAKAAVA